MKIIHVESGRHVYGGARQALYIHEHLLKQDIDSYFTCTTNSEVAEEAKRIDPAKTIEMAIGGDLDFGLARRLYKLCKEQKPDILHLHSRRGADVMGGIAGQLAGTKVVLSRRVDNPEPKLWAKLKYRLYDKVITISNGIADVLKDCGVNPDLITTVRSAIEVDTYDRPADNNWFREEFKLAENTVAIGIVAQLIQRKGHRYVFSALETLTKEFPNLKLLIFGKGPLEEALRAEAETNGLSNYIDFCGFRTDLPKVLPCLDLLVHPADAEGLGVSLMQAAAAGVPIIASRVGGIPEAIVDGETGYLIQPGNIEELTTRMQQLIADDTKRGQFSDNARSHAREEFTLPAMVSGNLTVYQKLLNE